MKTVFYIAYTELRMLFYSPIAWLLLCLFAFQAGMAFTDVLGRMVEIKEMGKAHQLYLTYSLMAGPVGVLSGIINHLFWYIPLLTMGLMSREYNLGSVKLLYSSPVGPAKIIGGKYLALMLFGLILMLILVVQTICAAVWIKDLNVSWALTGIAGCFLVYCTYAAIGLFMSSLTQYSILAAVGTLLLLTFLSYVQEVGQEISFVREITWWLAMSERGRHLIAGLIGSEDLIYFVVVISMFIVLTILKLRAERQLLPKSVEAAKYTVVVVIALGIGYLSSRPSLMKYKDVTYIKSNTIPPKVQEFMKHLDDDLTFTLYVNLLDPKSGYGMPARHMAIYNTLKRFVRFKPDTKLNFVYYYDVCDNMPPLAAGVSLQDQVSQICQAEDYDPGLFLPPEEIRKQIDLSGEGNRLVYQVERANGVKAILRFFDDNNYEPSEQEISAALKRLAEGAVQVCFSTEHAERGLTLKETNYYPLVIRNNRQALVNQGFDFSNRSLEKEEEKLENTDILVIADPRTDFSPEALEKVRAYLAAGGNMLITGEPGRQDIVNRILEGTGVRLDSAVYQQTFPDYAPELLPGSITKTAAARIGKNIFARQQKVVLNGCAAIETGPGIFETMPVAELAENGHPLVVALHRTVNGKEQRIIVSGDSDLFTAGELEQNREGIAAANFSFMTEVFSYLSGERYPVDMTRPTAPDDTLYLSAGMYKIVKILFRWIIPALIVLTAAWILARRRRK